MKTKRSYRHALTWILLFISGVFWQGVFWQGVFWVGCSHAPHSENSDQLNHLPESAQNTGVEIEYVLGRDHYHFKALANGNQVTATSTINRRVLDQGLIKSDRYPEFLQKASHFIQQTQKTASQQLVCRTPFVVTVRTQTETQMVKGCRSTDDGTLSRLIRDGEFLLYSKN